MGERLAVQAGLHQLNPAHAHRVIAITDACDQELIELRACQAYVKAVAR